MSRSPAVGCAVTGLALLVSAGTAVPAADDALSDLAKSPTSQTVLTAEQLLESQPVEIVTRLHDRKLVMMQELREAGSLSGGLILGLVIFEKPVETVYRYLSQTARQIEYRPEVTSIETVEWNERGPVDVHRIRVLFRRYEYCLRYTLDPEARRIRWELNPDFDSDLLHVSGSWELFPLGEKRTLARFSTSVNVGPAVPGFLQDWITRKNVPRAMERARRWVDSEGRYRP